MNQKKMSPISLNEALAMSAYPERNHNYLKSFLFSKYNGVPNTKIFLVGIENNKQIFVIEYTIGIPFGNKIFDIKILLYIPELFPDYQPEFYIKEMGLIGINELYLNGQIDPNTLRINTDYFCTFNPIKNNIDEIMDKIFESFSRNFPIFKSSSKGVKYQGACALNTEYAIPISLSL